MAPIFLAPKIQKYRLLSWDTETNKYTKYSLLILVQITLEITISIKFITHKNVKQQIVGTTLVGLKQ